MTRLRAAVRALTTHEDGQSLVELSVKMVLVLALVGAIFLGFTRIAAASVPLEQCIAHQSCQAAASAHGG